MIKIAKACELTRTHDRDWFTGKNELTWINIDSFHAGKNDMITGAGIQDQDVTIAPERPGINNPAIGR